MRNYRVAFGTFNGVSQCMYCIIVWRENRFKYSDCLVNLIRYEFVLFELSNVFVSSSQVLIIIIVHLYNNLIIPVNITIETVCKLILRFCGWHGIQNALCIASWFEVSVFENRKPENRLGYRHPSNQFQLSQNSLFRLSVLWIVWARYTIVNLRYERWTL